MSLVFAIFWTSKGEMWISFVIKHRHLTQHDMSTQTFFQIFQPQVLIGFANEFPRHVFSGYSQIELGWHIYIWIHVFSWFYLKIAWSCCFTDVGCAVDLMIGIQPPCNFKWQFFGKIYRRIAWLHCKLMLCTGFPPTVSFANLLSCEWPKSGFVTIAFLAWQQSLVGELWCDFYQSDKLRTKKRPWQTTFEDSPCPLPIQRFFWSWVNIQ